MNQTFSSPGGVDGADPFLLLLRVSEGVKDGSRGEAGGVNTWSLAADNMESVLSLRGHDLDALGVSWSLSCS